MKIWSFWIAKRYHNFYTPTLTEARAMAEEYASTRKLGEAEYDGHKTEKERDALKNLAIE